MHNEIPQAESQSTSSGPEVPADKEWSALQQDLDTLGIQLAALRNHTAALGDDVITNLQARYDDVRRRTMEFRTATETQLDAARLSAWRQASQAEGAFNDARLRSSEMAKDTARQMWERSEPLRQGARDVGEGLAKAWSEILTSFGKAAGRLQTDATPRNGATPAPASPNDERRDSTQNYHGA
ncbi:MAG: hypothetical protein ACREDO_06985 [Methyloceanibacter sp.]